MILAIGEAALRPGEIFALNHSDVDYTTGLIRVRRQLDLASGVAGWPKDDEPRTIAMTPSYTGICRALVALMALLVAPNWTIAKLQTTRGWLERHARTIATVIIVLLAAALLRNGIVALTS